MRYIQIEKDKIPYSFDILLSNKAYTINLRYNNYSGDFTADLELNELTLIKGKKIVLNELLFEEFAYDTNGNKNVNFYDELLSFYDLTWQEKELTLDNLQETVLLYVMDRG